MKTLIFQTVYETLKIFLVAFVVCTVVLTIAFTAHYASKEGIPITHIAMCVPYLMVEVTRISIPATLLLAATTCFARMSGNNEIIALKSLGIPPWRILWPVMFLGIVVSLFSVWLNDLAMTWGRANLHRVLFNSLEGMILNELKTKQIYSFSDGEITIRVEGVDNKTLLGVTVTSVKDETTIVAREANIRIDLERSELQVMFRHLGAKIANTSLTATEDSFAIPLSRIGMEREMSDRPSEMGLALIPADIEKQNEFIASGMRSLAARSAFTNLLGGRDMLGGPSWSFQQIMIREAKKRLSRLRVEPPRRWANGFSCFFFVWVGAPLAIRMRKADIFTSFFACFLPILILYYPMMILGVEGAKSGALPPPAVWLGNIALGVIGLGLWRTVHRY